MRLICLSVVSFGLSLSASSVAEDGSDLPSLKVRLSAAEKKLAALAAEFRKRLPSIPEYRAAQKPVDDLEAELEDVRRRKDEKALDAIVKAKLDATKQRDKVVAELKEKSLKSATDEVAEIRSRIEALSKPVGATKGSSGDKRAKKSLIGRVGDLEIWLLDYSVKTVPMISIMGNRTESQVELLWVKLRIANLSDNKKSDYCSWRGDIISIERDFATAQDSFGNRLKRVDFGIGAKIIGACGTNESIYPGKSVEDIIVFEKPVPGSKSVNLLLPRGNVSAEGEPFTVKLSLE